MRATNSRSSRLHEISSGRRSPGTGKPAIRRDHVLNEPAFRAMLALERRRAERSGRSFILMLLDVTAVDGARAAGVPQQLAHFVCGAIRESDLMGWYLDREVLGVVFTEIDDEQKQVHAEALRRRLLEVVQMGFEKGIAAKIALSVHVFPENWTSGSSDPAADIKLYPDVEGKAPKLPLIVKRLIDILGSAALLLVLAPVLAAIAIAIKLTSKGPVIFKQERLGRLGKGFQCMKFRTMYVNNDERIHREYVQSFIAGKVAEEKKSETEVVYKIQNDPRVTSVGAFLRRTSLDELPQFWNVLMGEMSLVGPRPSLAYEFQAYDLWHRRRVLEVKPGVTGLWQVIGRSRTTFPEMVRMDLRYCQHWSLSLDLKILLATPLAVVRGHGAY
jgi:lipopolysaccharide/colanic/teichoic acid biosynthesis glycosyltransferase